MAKDKNDMSTEELIELTKQLFEEDKDEVVIKLLDDGILEKHNNEELYAYRSRSYNVIGEIDKGFKDAQKAISVNPEFSLGFFARGNYWYDKGEYDKAIDDYNKAIELNPKYDAAYNNRGTSWADKGEYDKAIDDYNKAIELNPKYDGAYNNRGSSWDYKRVYDKAIDDYNKAIELNPKYHNAYYNRGNSWYNKGDYDKAIKDYNKAIELKPDNVNAKYWLEKAKEKRNEELALKKKTVKRDDSNTRIQLFVRILDDANVDEFDTNIIMQICAKVKRDVVDKIREIAAGNIEELIQDNLVAHYTKLKVADLIVSNKESQHRFYNAVYMNDPQEGMVILNYMGDGIRECFEHANKEEEDNIYIGSYLPAKDHEDELVMWRTYGKDANKNEAAGCSIVLSTAFFDPFDGKENNAINPDIFTGNRSEKLATPPQCLYRVLYYNTRDNSEKRFECDKSEELQGYVDELKKYLEKLIDQKDKTEETDKNKAIDKIIYHLLSEVRFFFKSADYSFENEVRVIQFATKGDDRLIIDKEAEPKKVYLNSNKNVKPFIKKIILGPKVPNPKQWLFLEVAMKQDRGIGHENGYDIQVMQSKRKYQ